MDDNTVKAQLRRMRDFILDEAQNKKTEIQQSAEEEANREKDRLIRQGEISITKELDKKRKQVETAKKMYVWLNFILSPPFLFSSFFVSFFSHSLGFRVTFPIP